jgi:hypothetical protein
VGRTVVKCVAEQCINCRVKAVELAAAKNVVEQYIKCTGRQWNGLLASALLNIILNVQLNDGTECCQELC